MVLKRVFTPPNFLVISIVIPFVICLFAYAFFLDYLLRFHLHFNFKAMAFMIVVSPVLEEIVCRGLFQEIFLKLFKNNKLMAFLLVNIVFTMFHYHVRAEYLYLSLIFCCGMIYSFIRDQYSLGAAIYMHIYYNLVFIFFTYLSCT